jgi:MEMO1 family protein
MSFGPIVAGQFYTSNKGLLSDEIDEYLSRADVEKADPPPMGLICPHAGYVYSGPCAAYSYKTVAGTKFDVVVVLGLSHRVPGSVSVLNEESYRTPLGKVPIDARHTAQLLEAEDFIDQDRRLFAAEHSIEVQLPFLQKTVPDLSVVLISMRTISNDKCRRLAQALDQTFADCRALFIASSDLSHFHPYEKARRMDLETLEMVRNGEIEKIASTCGSGENEMCGLGPVMTLMHLFKMRGGSKIEILKYMNSGDTAGDKDSVVGYGSVAFFGGGTAMKTEEKKQSDPGEYLNEQERGKCLEIARQSIETYLKKHGAPDYADLSEKLLQPGAAFVSLHRQGKLRGCVGQIEAREPLWMCVRDMAVAAASMDTRFSSVTAKELPELEIEISVLTPAEDVNDFGAIRIGVDGLIISRDFYRGLLLPQVAPQYDWSPEEFLDNTCVKAGLPPGAWKDPKTKVKKFQAQVFSET